MPIKVKGGVVLEVCLAKWWANIGHVDTSYSVEFHGIESQSTELVLHGADSYKRLNLTGALATEEVQPDISLKTLVQNYRPVEAKVIPLGARDVIPKGNRVVYELQVTYSFSVLKATEVTPNLSLLSDFLYESEFESQLWMLYNSQKQLVASGDAYPSKWPVKVGKDEYTLRAHVRHEKREVLDKMMDMPMSLEIKLAGGPVQVDYYTSFAQASTGGKKGNSFTLQPNKTAPIFVTAAASTCNDKHLKGATMGQYLLGSMTLSKDELGKKVGSIPVKYVFGEGAKRDKKDKKNENGKKTETFQDSLFEHKATWLAKMDPTTPESADLYQELLTAATAAASGEQAAASAAQQQMKELQAHAARLQSLDFDKKISLEKVTVNRAEEALKVADKILTLVKANDILAFFAVKNNDLRPAADGGAASSEKKDMEKKRGWYLEAMAKKGLALCVLEGRLNEAAECLLNCLQFVDQTDPKVVFFATVHAERCGHLGRAVKLIQHQLDEKPNSPDLDARLVYLYEKLGWEHAAKMAKLTQPIRFPKEFDLF